MTPEEIIRQIDLDDFNVKASLMALGAHLFSGNLDQLELDFAKVNPELRKALLQCLNQICDYLDTVLEKLDPEYAALVDAESEEWPDLFEEAKRELAEDGNL